MLELGWVQEVTSLIDQGYPPQLRSMQSIGYRQLTCYIQGQTSLEEAVLQIKKETKRFAKRQLTWLRNNPQLIWIKLPEKAGDVEALIKKFLNIR
jgi:tRNA dimethylallyltransferase